MAFFKPKPKFKILFVAPEASPFVKAGGLGEGMNAAPRAPGFFWGGGGGGRHHPPAGRQATN